MSIAPFNTKAYRAVKGGFHDGIEEQHLEGEKHVAVAAQHFPWALQFDVDHDVQKVLDAFDLAGWTWLCEFGEDMDSGHVYVPVVQDGHRPARWWGFHAKLLVEKAGLVDVCGPLSDLVRVDTDRQLRLPLTRGRVVRLSSRRQWLIRDEADQVECFRAYLELTRVSYELLKRGRDQLEPRSQAPTPQNRNGGPITSRSLRTRVRTREEAVDELIDRWPDAKGRRWEYHKQGICLALRYGLQPEQAAKAVLEWLRCAGSQDANAKPGAIYDDLVRCARKIAKSTMRKAS